MMAKRVGRSVSLLASAAGLAAGFAPARAQEAPPPPTPSATAEGPRVFTPADFARFAPRNALDMLRQVPGFVIREAVIERGLGQATGNVLLNGQRLAGKSEDIQTQLNRIPAQNVVRIEILDGATLDIPGLSGQVANVVARAGGISGQFAWRPEFRRDFADPLLTRFEISVTGRHGPVEYTLGLENQSSHSAAGGLTLITDAGGGFIERRDDVWTGEFEQPRVSGRFAIDGPGSSIGNLNLSYRRYWYDYVENGVREGPGLPVRHRRVDIDEEGHNYEIGGDFEFALGPGRLKLIGLDRFDHVVPDTVVITRFDDGTPDEGDRFTRIGDESERIARGEYRWNGGGADWQVSAEAAFNSLDNLSRLFELDADGAFEEVPLPGSSARVEEDRYEVMASYSRTLSPRLSFQLAAGGEYSQLSQVGGGGLTRTFWRPKGTFSAAWKPDPRTDVNFRFQRRVGQLNFFDFLASVNLTDDRENASNPNLVPPQSWEAEVEWVRNLGAWGTTGLRVYGHLIDDIVDIVPIGATGEAVGNIDRAVRYGAEWKSTFNFDPVGWRGAKLDARFQLQGSRVDDPLTGEPREIGSSLMRLAALTLRHDVPDTDWAWGGALNYEYYSRDYRLTEVGRLWEGPVWLYAYVEHKDVFGLTVRASINNILGADSMWDRTVFVGRRTGPVDFIERRDRIIGPIFSFQVRGRF
ncbi:MAG TPA: TonB-dependent receptor [Allosphingosinicella sp.]|nr:TonB-dependent receptor [Allosphingosinicella sp.]